MSFRSVMITPLLFAVVAGCGGSEGGGSAPATVVTGPTPTPVATTPAPSPAASPTPSASTYPTVASLAAATQLMSADSGFTLYDPPNSLAINGFGEGTTFDYDPTARSIATVNGPMSETFVASEIVASSSTPSTRWVKASGNYFELVTPIASGSPADYVRYADYTSKIGSLSTRILALTGIPTRTADLPTSGRAEYTRSNVAGEALIRQANRTPIYYGLSASTVTLVVDFSAKTITSTIRLVGTPRAGGPDVSLATITGTTGFDGRSNVTATAPDYPSTDKALLAGVVFGPAAAEAGFIVNLGVINRTTNAYLDVVALGFADR